MNEKTQTFERKQQQKRKHGLEQRVRRDDRSELLPSDETRRTSAFSEKLETNTNLSAEPRCYALFRLVPNNLRSCDGIQNNIAKL